MAETCSNRRSTKKITMYKKRFWQWPCYGDLKKEIKKFPSLKHPPTQSHTCVILEWIRSVIRFILLANPEAAPNPQGRIRRFEDEATQRERVLVVGERGRALPVYIT